MTVAPEQYARWRRSALGEVTERIATERIYNGVRLLEAPSPSTKGKKL